MSYQRVLLITTLLVCAAAASRAGAETRSVYFIGSSTIDQVNYRGLDAMATQQGHTHNWGRHMIPGAGLEWIWNRGPDSNGDGIKDDPSGFKEAPYGYYFSALPNFAWDAVILTPVDRHLGSDSDYGARFINLARTNPANSATQFYVFSRWPRNEPNNAHLPKIAAGPRAGQVDYSAQWLRSYNLNQFDSSIWTRDYYEQLTRKLNADLPALQPDVKLVPVGDVLFALNARMRAGDFAKWGLDDVLDLYEDGAHFTNVGQFVVGTTFYATLYKANPTGLAVPTQYDPRVGKSLDQQIPAELAVELQETVWSVVSTHPLAGVPEPSVGVAAGPGLLLLHRRRATAQP